MMRQRLATAAAIFLLASGVSTGLAAAAKPLVIMPLGDSITAGSDGGYRKPLVKLLASKYHLNVTTSGSQTDDKLPKGQQAHEGHGGWRIDQLSDNLLGVNGVDDGAHGGHWLKGGQGTGRGPSKANVVLVSAGINDINQFIGNDPASPMSDRTDAIQNTLHERLTKLVDQLTDNLPDATILLGGCIPYNNGLLSDKLTGATDQNRAQWAAADGVSPMQEMGVNHQVILFNKWVRDTYVPELQKQGKKAHFVDLYAKFILPNGEVRGWNNEEPEKSHGPSGYGDFGLHPNAFGYGLMAEAWAEAIARHAGK